MTDLFADRDKIFTIEAARGLAAVLVILYHANFLCNVAGFRPLDSFFAFGDSAVNFFFVLSGFIITWVHRKDWGMPRRSYSYVWRRFMRIYPTYWVATLLFTLPLVFVPWIRSMDLSLGPVYILRNILLAPTDGYLVIPPAWTLQHEVLFYGLFTILILNKVVGAVVFLTWTAGVFLANIFVDRLDFPYTFFFSPVNLQFVIGMICALLVGEIGHRRSLILFVFGCLLFFGASISQVKAQWVWAGFIGCPISFALIKGIGAALMIVGMVAAESNRHLRPGKPLMILGNASYSVYLVHLPSMVVFLFVLIATDLVDILSANIIFALLAGYGLAVGLIFHRIVERPILDCFRGGENQPATK